MTSSTSRGSAARRRGASNRPARHHHRPSTRPAHRPARSAPEFALTPAATENLPSFADLGLPGPIVKTLARAGVATPFPIQAATIPDALAGRDLLGKAATGSGKTLGFGLPLLTRLSRYGNGGRSAPRRPRGLVLVPTRELAMQVSDALSPLASSVELTVRLVAGGLSITKQVASLERGVDVLVATPGRLEDLIARRACDLSDVEITVLDEADHMCDLGFLPVVRRLLKQTRPDGQRLLFSATLDGEVGTLVAGYLSEPAGHAVPVTEQAVDAMSHHVFRVAREGKFPLVAAVLGREGRTIGFVRTKHGADRIVRDLGRVGVRAGVLHGGRSQSQRTRALEAFKDGSVPVLVATDVAARGIHVDDVSLVLHIDPPADPKDYLHRSGRTARAGESGTVVVLATPDTERDVRSMLAAAGVQAEQRDATAESIDVARVTGARAPSGVPVPKPAAAPQPARRPRADNSGGRRRSPGGARGRNPRTRGARKDG